MIILFIYVALSLCATQTQTTTTTTTTNLSQLVTFSTNHLCEDLCVLLDTDHNITFLNEDTVAKYVYLPDNYTEILECDYSLSRRENFIISPNQSLSYKVGQDWPQNVSKIDQLDLRLNQSICRLHRLCSCLL